MIATSFSPQLRFNPKLWGIRKNDSVFSGLNVKNRLRFSADIVLFHAPNARKLSTPSEELKNFELFLKRFVYPLVETSENFESNLRNLRFLVKYIDTPVYWRIKGKRISSHTLIANIYNDAALKTFQRNTLDSYRKLFHESGYIEDNWGDILINHIFDSITDFYGRHRQKVGDFNKETGI